MTQSHLQRTEAPHGVAAFEAAFREYHPVILAAAYNRLSQMSDAEDATAEVFARAWRRRDNADVLNIAWLYTTLRNVVGSEYRSRERHRRRLDRSGSDRELEYETPKADEILDLRAAVNRLEASDRELIWMSYWEDLRPDEIAEILGCSRTALRVRLHRARKRLAATLTPEDIRDIEEGR